MVMGHLYYNTTRSQHLVFSLEAFDASFAACPNNIAARYSSVSVIVIHYADGSEEECCYFEHVS